MHSLSDLEAFAGKRIAAKRYPGDYHRFQLARCSACGVVPLELTIEQPRADAEINELPRAKESSTGQSHPNG